MMMAGPLHPPFSLFLTGEKERMRRARWKREKDGDAFRGRGVVRTVLVRKSPARSVVRAGVLAVDERTVLPSSLPLTWRFRWPLHDYWARSSAINCALKRTPL